MSIFKSKLKNKEEEVKQQPTEAIEESIDSEVIDKEFSLHSNEGRISKMQKEYMEKEIEELPPMKKGQINISSMYLYDDGDRYEVKIYIRNGLMNNVNFDQVPFMIVNKKGEVLAHQVFDLKEMGIIPSYGAMPWKLYFDKENVTVESIDLDDWQVVFDANLKAIKNINTVFEGIPESLDDASKKQLEEHLNSLPLIKEGNLNISTFFIGPTESGSILIILVFRNAVSQDATIKQLPVSVKDDSGKLVAGGIFDTNLTIRAHKAKVCNLEFAPENVAKGDVNLDNLSVYFEFDKNATL